jgi:hypothetical protein
MKQPASNQECPELGRGAWLFERGVPSIKALARIRTPILAVEFAERASYAAPAADGPEGTALRWATARLERAVECVWASMGARS